MKWIAHPGFRNECGELGLLQLRPRCKATLAHCVYVVEWQFPCVNLEMSSWPCLHDRLRNWQELSPLPPSLPPAAPPLSPPSAPPLFPPCISFSWCVCTHPHINSLSELSSPRKLELMISCDRKSIGILQCSMTPVQIRE